MQNDDFILVRDNVIAPELCQQIIETFATSPNQKPGRTGGGVDVDKKRSLDAYFSEDPEFAEHFKAVLPLAGDVIKDYMQEYFCALVGPIGLTVAHPQTGEPVKLTAENFNEIGLPNLPNLMNYLFRIGRVNIQKYNKQEGGYPYWHSEVYPESQHNEALHRVLLWMIYLNDVEEGGTTDFYYQNRSIQPKAGTMVVAPAYFTHTHRGQVPVSNDKYILTSWMMFNRAESIYTQKG